MVARYPTRHTVGMTRVALLDDHPAVLAGLRRLLESEPGLHVVAGTGDHRELPDLLDRTEPDILILDHDLAHVDGLAQCLRVKRRPDPPAVVVYAAYTGAALAIAARAAGADALVDKAEPVHRLLAAIRGVAGGAKLIPAPPADAYAAAVARVDDDDLPLLAMLLDGTPVEDIAVALQREPGEVGWRAQRIVGRLCPGLRQRPPADAPAPSPSYDI
jgi:DNA-binding NarL/FixJ family response regulator